MHAVDPIIPVKGLRAALDEAIDEPPRLLPSSPIYPALSARRPAVAKWVHQSISAEWAPALESVVPVSKGRHGIRPVAVWDIGSRLTYSSLVRSLDPDLSPPIRTTKAWNAFLKSPLKEPGDYVVAADIAACYQYIDHTLLAQELLTQSGATAEVDAICRLLREVSGRTYGLPQQSKASDVLANAYLDRLERSVLRRGVLVTRYNDDFRFNGKSWSDVVRGLEILAEEARRVGLVLNDSKVVTWKKPRYRRRLEAANELRDEIAFDAELDLTQFEIDYDGMMVTVEPDKSEVEIAAAAKVLERWSRVAGKGTVAATNQAEHRALVELVPIALRALSTDTDDVPGVLDITMELLRYEQTMTPQVCRYLMTRTDEGAVLKALDRLIGENAYLTGWQMWWLQQPLARLTNLVKGKGSTGRRDWLKTAFDASTRSPMLRAETALTLARHKMIDVETLLAIYDRSSAVERPSVVAALGLLKPGNSVRRGVTGDSKLHEWVFDWAVTGA